MILDDGNDIMMFRRWQFWMLKWWVLLTLFQCEVSSCSTEHLFAAKIWKEGENQNERGIWPEGKEKCRTNLQPAKSGPHTVLFSHMIAPWPEDGLGGSWGDLIWWWTLNTYILYTCSKALYIWWWAHIRGDMLPVPKLSSPQSAIRPGWWLNYHQRRVQAIRPASSREPKYFHPVGVSKHSRPRASATLAKTN